MLAIYGNDYKSPLLERLSSDVQVCSIEEIDSYRGSIPKNVKICVTHEEALEAVRHKMLDNSNAKAMELFRNKAALRAKLFQLFPDFYFKKIGLSSLSKQELDFQRFSQYVVKPVKGFFGIGVRIITPDTNLQNLQAEIEAEIKTQGIEHPEYVKDQSLSVQDFLIEEYIGKNGCSFYSLENAEIAIDGYYNENGKFTLLSIYHHPYRNDRKYFHLLYYTSQELFEKFSAELINFFDNLQKKLELNVRCFPLHAEFRNYRNKLLLIEVNPGRFGGLGLGDLIFYGFGVNPYEIFFSNKSFDWSVYWEKVKQEGKGLYFAWVLAYRGESFKNKSLHFRHDEFKNFLGSGLIRYEPISSDNSVFSVSFINKNKKEDLYLILNVDFDEFSSVDSIK